MKFERYLGIKAEVMLSEIPFKQWLSERSVEEDLEEPIVHYVFPENGLELRCDLDDRISVIFLFANDYGGFDESHLETPFTWNRSDVLDFYGVPSKSGKASNHPILGNYGAWDRFSKSGYAIRFEYTTDNKMIKKITFMREDLVP